jgi:DNA mismatch repair protein MutS2
MNNKGVYGVITTHYTNLKHFASASAGIINGAMLFDTGEIKPLFRLEIGKPGSSFAIDIARKIGLPEEILNEASGKIGEDHINFDRHLREIIRDKRYWESKRERIRRAEKELSGVLEKYSGELEQVQKLKKEILEKARQEAAELLSKANREIENTIRVIKESQAERERTKDVRKTLADTRESLLSGNPLKDKQLEDKIQQLKKQGDKYLNPKDQEAQTEKKSNRKTSEKKGFEVGDRVKIYGQDVLGEVMDIHGENLMVSFGNMITTLKATRLVKLSESEARDMIRSEHVPKSHYASLLERKTRFKPEVDIRGKRGEEALDLVRNLVDEALVVGARELRILHGKGHGILKQLVREYLSSLDVVRSCHDEHVERGGAGITIVHLEY